MTFCPWMSGRLPSPVSSLNGMDTPWFESDGLDHRGHGRHQPVAPSGDVLNEARVAGVVTEGGAEFGDDLGEGVVGDEFGMPNGRR